MDQICQDLLTDPFMIPVSTYGPHTSRYISQAPEWLESIGGYFDQ